MIWKILAVAALATALSGCSVFCGVPVLGTFEPQCEKGATAPESP